MIRLLGLAGIMCLWLLTGRAHAQQAAPTGLLFGESDAPSVQLCQLLFYEDVRKKLRIEEEHFKHLTDQLFKLRQVTPTANDFENLSFADRFQYVDKIKAEAKAMDASVWQVLSELLPPEQMHSLMGAHMNYFGPTSILNPRMAAELSITDGQREQIATVIEQHRLGKRSLLTDIASLKAPASRPALTQNKLMAEIGKQLGESQRTRLAEMLAEGEALMKFSPRLTLGW